MMRAVPLVCHASNVPSGVASVRYASLASLPKPTVPCDGPSNRQFAPSVPEAKSSDASGLAVGSVTVSVTVAVSVSAPSVTV